MKDTNLRECSFSTAVFNSLNAFGLKTVKDLYKLTPITWWRIRGLGIGGLKEVSAVMEDNAEAFWKREMK